MTRLIGTMCAAGMAVMALAAPALAQGPGQGMVMQNCQAEIEKFCADVPHEAGAVPKCLEGHKSELSDACKTALENRGPKGPGMGRMKNQ